MPIDDQPYDGPVIKKPYRRQVGLGGCHVGDVDLVCRRTHIQHFVARGEVEAVPFDCTCVSLGDGRISIEQRYDNARRLGRGGGSRAR